MPGKGRQHQLPLVLQLVKNSEEQRAADTQRNSEERDHGLQFFTRQPKEGVDFGAIIEWVGVFFRLFDFPCFPVVSIDMGIRLEVSRLLVAKITRLSPPP